MSRNPWCEECEIWHAEGNHSPLFHVLIPEQGDEWTAVHSCDAQSAAEKACEMDDINSSEYSIVTQGGIKGVLVKDNEGNVQRYNIEAEATPTYYAREDTQ